MSTDMTLCQFAFRVCLRGTSEASHTSDRRQKVPLNWLSVQPMRIVLLIAKGSLPVEAVILKNHFSQSKLFFGLQMAAPLWRPPFSRQNCVQSREVNQISPRCLQGGVLKATLVIVRFTHRSGAVVAPPYIRWYGRRAQICTACRIYSWPLAQQ